MARRAALVIVRQILTCEVTIKQDGASLAPLQRLCLPFTQQPSLTNVRLFLWSKLRKSVHVDVAYSLFQHVSGILIKAGFVIYQISVTSNLLSTSVQRRSIKHLTRVRKAMQAMLLQERHWVRYCSLRSSTSAINQTNRSEICCGQVYRQARNHNSQTLH